VDAIERWPKVVTRLAVVERIESPPGRLAAGQLPDSVRGLLNATDRSRRYAAAGITDLAANGLDKRVSQKGPSLTVVFKGRLNIRNLVERLLSLKPYDCESQALRL
jgi:hypothetical protein